MSGEAARTKLIFIFFPTCVSKIDHSNGKSWKNGGMEDSKGCTCAVGHGRTVAPCEETARPELASKQGLPYVCVLTGSQGDTNSNRIAGGHLCRGHGRAAAPCQ